MSKLRVVFDASSKSLNGNSLNDCLLHGPRLQGDVCDISFRFCLNQFPLSPNVPWIYRQVVLDDCYTDFHRNLWRNYVTEEIQELRVTCVTQSECVLAPPTIRPKRFRSVRSYAPIVDVVFIDLWVSADTLKESCKLQDHLIETIRKNCHPLGEWSNNNSTGHSSPHSASRSRQCIQNHYQNTSEQNGVGHLIETAKLNGSAFYMHALENLESPISLPRRKSF